MSWKWTFVKLSKSFAYRYDVKLRKMINKAISKYKPICTSSRFSFIIKCHGNALQNVAGLIFKSDAVLIIALLAISSSSSSSSDDSSSCFWVKKYRYRLKSPSTGSIVILTSIPYKIFVNAFNEPSSSQAITGRSDVKINSPTSSPID